MPTRLDVVSTQKYPYVSLVSLVFLRCNFEPYSSAVMFAVVSGKFGKKTEHVVSRRKKL
jgi:hypothetical protein